MTFLRTAASAAQAACAASGRAAWCAALLLFGLFACGPSASSPPTPAAGRAEAATQAATPGAATPSLGAGATAAPIATGPRVVFLGDSLTAGLGLSVDQAFPARVGAALSARGLPAQVVNAGVSGDTTAGGLRRVDWLLGQKPDVLVLALGANDMLRGLSPEECAANLRAIVEKARAGGTDVLLVGMRANPTLGPEYVARFDAIYPALATEFGVPLVPFLLEGIAMDPALNQADGVHPTAAGHERIAALVLPALEPLVRARAAGGP